MGKKIVLKENTFDKVNKILLALSIVDSLILIICLVREVSFFLYPVIGLISAIFLFVAIVFYTAAKNKLSSGGMRKYMIVALTINSLVWILWSGLTVFVIIFS